MGEASVIIIGAGAAGLAAADVLGRSGIPVLILEARNRVGGRIHTTMSKTGDLPIELGAEFVHGAKNAVWDIVQAAGLETQEVPNRHWYFVGGGLEQGERFSQKLEQVISRINVREPDQDFCAFLKQAGRISEWAKTLALEYVEGFHAADPKRVSIHSLARAETASESDEADRQFRIAKGYGEMLKWSESQLAKAGTIVQLGAVVDSVRWEPGNVEVTARTSTGHERFRARLVLVTLPLGVLQSQGPARVAFTPTLSAKQPAIEGLSMGAVVKITFQFQTRFWPVENFGFIHAPGTRFPTWWSDERGVEVTGWTGGPRAEELGKQSFDSIQAEAIDALASMFKKERRRVEELLVAAYRHDWMRDPFSQGAYSYTPLGMAQMASKLAAPMSETLFFAGEATDSEGEQGTVHGAIASGRRAAGEMLRAGTIRGLWNR